MQTYWSEEWQIALKARDVNWTLKFNEQPQLTSAPSNHLDIAMLQQVPGPEKKPKNNIKQVLNKKTTEFPHRIAVEMLAIHTATFSRPEFFFDF